MKTLRSQALVRSDQPLVGSRNRSIPFRKNYISNRKQLQFELLEDRRLLTGALDKSFGDHGIVTTAVTSISVPNNETDAVEAMVQQANGKLIVLGRSYGLDGEWHNSIVRYLPSGTIDQSFGGDGIVSVPLGFVKSLAVQPDGRVIVSGSKPGTSFYGADWALARFNVDGSLDDSFGIAGIVQTPIERFGNATSIVLLNDGRILAGGYAYTSVHADFALARYNIDGSLDTSFGVAGIVLTQISPDLAGDYIEKLLVQPDGKLVAVGFSFSSATNNDTVVARYNSDGTVDTAFGGGDGIATIVLSDHEDLAASAVLQDDGKIVPVGYRSGANGGELTLVRLLDTGLLDDSFGDGDGIVAIQPGVGHSGGTDIALQSDAKIVVSFVTGNGTDVDFAIARFNSNGSLDSSFSGDGIVTTAISDGTSNSTGEDFQADDFTDGLLVQPDGNIVVAGTTVADVGWCDSEDPFPERCTDTDFALVRYIGQDLDADGVNEFIEAAAPNGGDGNDDGLPDNQQANVASLPTNTPSANYLTLATPAGTSLTAVGIVSNPAPASAPPGIQFPIGHLDFEVNGIMAGAATTVVLYLPDDTVVNTYYKYGPTPEDAYPHWYSFMFDGTTGAVIDAGIDADNDPETIMLHFVDGDRGDDDLTANGTIVDPGAPGFNTAPLLDSSGFPRLTTIPLDAVENPGTLVRDMLRRAKHLDLNQPPPYFRDSISDADPGAAMGIAIVGVDTANGDWEFSIDGGGSWQSLGEPIVSAARLLNVDDFSRIRFIPQQGFSGTIAAAITFRAWDRTDGVNGGELNATATGGSTSLSVQAETASLTVAPSAHLLTGVATIGDSIAGAYEFVPQRNTARAWIEQLEMNRGVNLGPFSYDPVEFGRVPGRAFTWGSPPPLPQVIVDGVSAQIANGEVTLVDYAFGQLHIAGRYADIYNGVLAGPALTTLIDNAIAETTAALDAFTAAGDVKLVLQNWGDVGQAPLFRQIFPDVGRRQLVMDAIEAANSKLKAEADTRGIPVVEFIEISKLSSSAEPLIVGGVAIDKNNNQDFHPDPTHFLEDALHPGSVVMGLMTNMFIEAVNRAYGVGLEPLSDQEILFTAGIAPPIPGPTYYDVSQFVHAKPVVSVSGPNEGLEGQELSFQLTAAYPYNSASSQATFRYSIDWDGDDVVDQTIIGDSEVVVVHAFESSGSFPVRVTVTDAFDASSDSVELAVELVISPLTASNLDAILQSLVPQQPGNVVVLSVEVNNDLTLHQSVDAVNSLTAQTSPVAKIILNLAASTSFTSVEANLADGVTLALIGAEGTSIIGHSSPGVTVQAGSVCIETITLVGRSDSPTVRVHGGSLEVRNSTIIESDGGTSSAIRIVGGNVDLGLVADPGGNTLVVMGAGRIIDNDSSAGVSAIGNAFRREATLLVSNFKIEDEIEHALDESDRGLVTYVSGQVFVTLNSASIQRAIDAVDNGFLIHVKPNDLDDFSIGSRLLTVQFENGPRLALVADEFAPTQRTLDITGTPNADEIRISRQQSDLRAQIDDYPKGRFSVTGRVVIHAGYGNDEVQIASSVERPAWIYGGAGNDELQGGKGDDLIFGEEGNDELSGGQGRDILIGGTGRDEINGNSGDDILIAGLTDFDQLPAALWGMMNEWTSSRTYEQRTANLSGNGNGPSFAARLNGNYFLTFNGPTATVRDDNDRDKLVGSSGRDWFFANLSLEGDDQADRKDIIEDLQTNELALDLDLFN